MHLLIPKYRWFLYILLIMVHSVSLFILILPTIDSKFLEYIIVKNVSQNNEKLPSHINAHNIMKNSTKHSYYDALKNLKGLWKSRGYGWLLAISENKIQLYDVLDAGCIPNNDPDFDLKEFSYWFLNENDKNIIKVTIEDPDYFYTFDQIDYDDMECKQILYKDPIFVFDTVKSYFSKHYAFFNLRHISWDVLTERYRKKINKNTTELELFRVLSELLGHVKDAHVNLEAEINHSYFEFNSAEHDPLIRPALKNSSNSYWAIGVGEKLIRHNKYKRAKGTIVYGFIDEDVGYIAIKEMEGAKTKKVEDAIDDALILFKNAKILMVDISMNDGGYDHISRSIASKFTTSKTLAYYKYAADSQREAPQPMYLVPSRENTFSGPIFMITSKETASAAEIFVMSMRALPNVVHLGEATNGIFNLINFGNNCQMVGVSVSQMRYILIMRKIIWK